MAIEMNNIKKKQWKITQFSQPHTFTPDFVGYLLTIFYNKIFYLLSKYFLNKIIKLFAAFFAE